MCAPFARQRDVFGRDAAQVLLPFAPLCGVQTLVDAKSGPLGMREQKEKGLASLERARAGTTLSYRPPRFHVLQLPLVFMRHTLMKPRSRSHSTHVSYIVCHGQSTRGGGGFTCSCTTHGDAPYSDARVWRHMQNTALTKAGRPKDARKLSINHA
jgi:hypothetical protein